jgi:hypothetical protein
MLPKISEKFEAMGIQIIAFEANPFDTVNVPIEELRDIVPLEVWLNVLERQKRLDIGMAAAQNPGMGGSLASAGVGLGVGQQMGAMLGGNQGGDVSALQQQMAQQQAQMQQLMMMMMQNQQGGGAQPAQAPATQAPNPQTKEQVQALIDQLDMKLASGEITEAIYNKLVAKWQERLDSM